jgi:hypothetical protein
MVFRSVLLVTRVPTEAVSPKRFTFDERPERRTRSVNMNPPRSEPVPGVRLDES